METPVAFIIFNRPAVTYRAFEAIARARPRQLFIIADGPRTPAEAGLCQAARTVIERVDWPCDVRTNFSGVNLGCRLRPPSGISWVFEHCEQAIILEDDCLPHPSFFPYCDELLVRYRNDPRVMVIGGNNFQAERRWSPHSYFFSRVFGIWGWATWRRAWQHYDLEMARWKQLRETGWLRDLLGKRSYANYYRKVFDQVCYEQFNTWDYQWKFAVWANDGLGIKPRVNLVANLGFGDEATHTLDSTSPYAVLPAKDIGMPLLHPPRVECLRDADNAAIDRLLADEPGLVERWLRRAERIATRTGILPWMRRAS